MRERKGLTQRNVLKGVALGTPLSGSRRQVFRPEARPLGACWQAATTPSLSQSASKPTAFTPARETARDELAPFFGSLRLDV